MTDSFEELRQRQIEQLTKLADMLEAGEPLTPSQAKHAARGLHRAIEALEDARPPAQRRGAPSKAPEWDVRFDYLILSEKIPSDRAISELAEKYGVSTTAIKKTIGMLAGTGDTKAPSRREGVRQSMREIARFLGIETYYDK
ncbi:MAG: hypothetical protein E6Q69_08900 [Aquipseudomonas alcaligenes]|uniref:Uncharacterized protein n=1 Tax=Aquipseudomonas alcaligenes TaxID=43263 RepID=A0A5C7W585_AQUAC|nr:MAG: hypothetical protein E6Q69_08900 [Pseudomonas alcaligenes]